MRTGYKQGKMRLNCFYLQAEIGAALAMKQKKAEQLHPLCLHSEKQELRILLLKCHAPPQEPPLFIKGPAEGGIEAFCLWLLLWTLA
jgi:hypothetical protein